jgi:hypothetical protein
MLAAWSSGTSAPPASTDPELGLKFTVPCVCCEWPSVAPTAEYENLVTRLDCAALRTIIKKTQE